MKCTLPAPAGRPTRPLPGVTMRLRNARPKPVLLIDHRADQIYETPPPHGDGGVEIVAIRDPYTALSILSDDPSGYALLVISETVFATDDDEDRFLRLLRHARGDHGIGFGVLLANGAFRETNIFAHAADSAAQDAKGAANIFAA